MFPNNVGRIIIDGVVDSEDYYAALWSNNFIDTDKTMFALCEACVEAGPEECLLYEQSTADVYARIMNIHGSLRSSPASFYNQGSGVYDILDAGVLGQAIFTTLYNPHAAGAILLAALAALEKGDSYPIWQMSTRRQLKQSLACTCPEQTVVPYLGLFHTVAIACSDAKPITDSVDELRTYLKELEKQSMLAAPYLTLRVGCSGWKVPAKEQYRGNFTGDIVTGHPLLVIGNTADPVTPLWAARKMSKAFKDSVVLTLNAPGHCSVSAVSLCIMSHVRSYFQTGILPEPNITCQAESTIFRNKTMADLGAMSVEEREVLTAARELHENYFVPRMGMGSLSG